MTEFNVLARRSGWEMQRQYAQQDFGAIAYLRKDNVLVLAALEGTRPPPPSAGCRDSHSAVPLLRAGRYVAEPNRLATASAADDRRALLKRCVRLSWRSPSVY